MARKRENSAETTRAWDLEEHQRQIVRLFMRQKGFSRVRMGQEIGMAGNAFGLRVQESWSSDEPQPVFKPVELYRIMRVLGIEDANLLFRPATLALVPTFDPEANRDNQYKWYYHGISVIPSDEPRTRVPVPA